MSLSGGGSAWPKVLAKRSVMPWREERAGYHRRREPSTHASTVKTRRSRSCTMTVIANPAVMQDVVNHARRNVGAIGHLPS